MLPWLHHSAATRVSRGKKGWCYNVNNSSAGRKGCLQPQKEELISDRIYEQQSHFGVSRVPEVTAAE